MRKKIYKLHRWLGLVTGAALLLLGLTGTILVFRVEIDRALSPRLLSVRAGERRLPYDEVLRRARSDYPGAKFTRFIAPPTPTDALLVAFEETGVRRQAAYDPYTGARLGDRHADSALMNWLLTFHFSFFLGYWGWLLTALLTALLGVLLGVSSLTGLYVHRKFFKHLLTLRVRSTRRIFLSDLHKLVGVWALVFNVLVGLSGAWMNLPGIIELFSGERQAKRENASPPFVAASLDAMLARAGELTPSFRPTLIDFPIADGDPVHMYGGAEKNRPLDPLYGAFGYQFDFDAASGAVRKVIDPATSGWKAWIDALAYPVHTGQYTVSFGSLAIKLIYCLGGLAPGALSVSGFLIWRKRTANLKRRSHHV